MKMDDFIGFIRREFIQKRLDIYVNYLKDSPRTETGDEIWQGIFRAWDSMNDAQRLGMLTFVRLAIVETVSTILDRLDNNSFLSSYPDNFQLTYGTKNEKLNGDLLDLFLSAEESDPQDVRWNSVE